MVLTLWSKIHQLHLPTFIWCRDFPCGSGGKESACNAEDPSSIPGLGRLPEEGNDNPLQYSCLENPTDRGTWWVTVHEVTKSRTYTHTHTHTHTHTFIWILKNISVIRNGNIPGWTANIHFLGLSLDRCCQNIHLTPLSSVSRSNKSFFLKWSPFSLGILSYSYRLTETVTSPDIFFYILFIL